MAREKQECPCCKRDLQARAMFNHIRKLHPDYFSSLLCLYKKDTLDELIKESAPMPVEWKVKDDFDEEDDIIIGGRQPGRLERRE